MKPARPGLCNHPLMASIYHAHHAVSCVQQDCADRQGTAVRRPAGLCGQQAYSVLPAVQFCTNMFTCTKHSKGEAHPNINRRGHALNSHSRGPEKWFEGCQITQTDTGAVGHVHSFKLHARHGPRLQTFHNNAITVCTKRQHCQCANVPCIPARTPCAICLLSCMNRLAGLFASSISAATKAHRQAGQR